MNLAADAYFRKPRKWQEEMKRLRKIILQTGLTEELKWGKPCYTFEGRNVVIIQGFKESCALLFCKGALLKDRKGVLKKPGENTQAARRIQFTNVREIGKMEAILQTFLKEAVAVEKAGLEVKYKDVSEFAVPEELRQKLNESPALKNAFEALTPGRQRGYLLYFSGAKQSKTRESRIEKYRRQILRGKGLDDR